jgi:para-aminobenzoate synthetase/4-amino-4-deoxychorismate lyase
VVTAWRLADVIPLLERVERHAREGRWAIGMVAYEAAAAFDQAFQTHSPPEGIPLAAFAIFDAPSKPEEETAKAGFDCSHWASDIPSGGFREKVERIREGIAAGAYYQVNLTTRLRAEFTGEPRAFFESLCEAQPGAYALFLDFGDWQIASVSPELFFAWSPAKAEIIARPMKGTAPLSRSAADLRASVKDCAENLMIVDLLRNDIARVARQGSVRVPELFSIETFATVRQMTSTIVGETRPDTTLGQIFAALFPCGSITGAPKIAAMRAIAALETSPRGAYCGALGVVQPGGAALFSVGIRTAILANGKTECGVGSGIIWDSDPFEEHRECQIKRRFLLRASAAFDLLESIKLEDGVYWLLDRHCARLQRSAEHFGFPFDSKAINRALRTIAEQHPKGAYAVRLLLSRRGSITTETRPLPATPADLAVALAETAVLSEDEFLHHKTTRRAVYEAHAPKGAGIFDTLLFNERHEITEFTRGNVAVQLDSELVTPPASSGLLPGTLRAELLAQGKLVERVLKRDEMNRASAIWFLNSLRGMFRVRLAYADFAGHANGSPPSSSRKGEALSGIVTS